MCWIVQIYVSAERFVVVIGARDSIAYTLKLVVCFMEKDYVKSCAARELEWC